MHIVCIIMFNNNWITCSVFKTGSQEPDWAMGFMSYSHSLMVTVVAMGTVYVLCEV